MWSTALVLIASLSQAGQDPDARLRELLTVIQVEGSGEPIVGLRPMVESLVRGTPIRVAVTPAAEAAVLTDTWTPVFPPAGDGLHTIPEQLERAWSSLRLASDIEVPLTWRVARGRLLVLTRARDRALDDNRRRREAVQLALSEPLALQPLPAEPAAEFVARVAAAWGRAVELDPALVGTLDLARPDPARLEPASARGWLQAAATQLGGTLAVRAGGVLLTTPERAARIAPGPVANDLCASDLCSRTLATPVATGEEWNMNAVIERLGRELDLDWPAHLRLSNVTWHFGDSTDRTLWAWLDSMTGIAGPGPDEETMIAPKWRIREGRVEIYDAAREVALDLAGEHDD